VLYRLALLLVVLTLAAPISAQLENVGSLSFPTSASPEAQRHFLRGVAILHSFGWKQAIAEFQRAQKAQPDFALAYWGESLCYNHPLMGEQDGKNPRAVLARLGPTREARLAKAPTPREKGFMEAVEALWRDGPPSAGDWRARRVAYRDAMARLHAQFPNDDEVTTFYALALLSAARAEDDSTFRPEMKAGALAMDVFRRNPNHPGATHYIIHAFDDPVHAPLALDAAFAYAKIVPAVSHAVHMPTHIFIQHGMWHEVAHQNIRAFNIAKELWQPGDSPGDMAHSGDWGQYGFLQLGDYEGARERIRAFEEMAATTKNARAASGLSLVTARYIVETEEWKVQPTADNAAAHAVLANGLSAVALGDAATADKMLALLASRAKMPAMGAAGGAHADHLAAPAPAAPPAAAADEGNKANRLMYLELAARIAESNADRPRAIALLRDAVAIEESMRPPNGAADPIKPSHEMLGEVLLRAGQHADAAAAFDACLLRMPRRPRSLYGASQAYAASGRPELARERWTTLQSFWKGKPFDPPTMANR
jgi:tetratricopeptide (TPR) repeat protein